MISIVNFTQGWPWLAYAAACAAVLLAVWFLVWFARRVITLARVRSGTAFVVGTVGLATAAFGTVRSLHAWGQPLPLAIMTSATIEGGAIYFAADLYMRTREGRAAGWARWLSWMFAAASSYANMAHPPARTTGAGVIIFGLLPLLGLTLIEYQAFAGRIVAVVTSDAWPVRVIRAAWRRGWTQIAAACGVDVDATDTTVERELAARRAATAMYRLRRAQLAHDSNPTRRGERRLRRRARQAQAARSVAAVATDPEQAVRLAQFMRDLVHGPEQAVGDWSDIPTAAARVFGREIPGLCAVPIDPPDPTDADGAGELPADETADGAPDPAATGSDRVVAGSGHTDDRSRDAERDAETAALAGMASDAERVRYAMAHLPPLAGHADAVAWLADRGHPVDPEAARTAIRRARHARTVNHAEVIEFQRNAGAK